MMKAQRSSLGYDQRGIETRRPDRAAQPGRVADPPGLARAAPAPGLRRPDQPRCRAGPAEQPGGRSRGILAGAGTDLEVVLSLDNANESGSRSHRQRSSGTSPCGRKAMRRTSKLSMIAGVMTLGIGLVGVVVAQDGSKVARSARGGDLVTTPRHQFEVFCYRTGLRVFPRGTSGAPVNVANLSGTVTFTLPGRPSPSSIPSRAAPHPPAGSPSPSTSSST